MGQVNSMQPYIKVSYYSSNSSRSLGPTGNTIDRSGGGFIDQPIKTCEHCRNSNHGQCAHSRKI